MALIDKASLLMVPSTYEAGKLYNVLPSGNRAPDSTGENSGYDQTRADFDFDRGSNAAATRVNADGLIEKYRENLLTYSNDFSQWSNSGTTEASGFEGYDGTNDAWEIEKTSASAYSSINKTLTATSGVVTISAYVKKGTLSVTSLYASGGTNPYILFSFDSATITAQRPGLIDTNIEDKGNGWYRISFTTTESIAQVTLHPDWAGTNTGTIYAQNVQVENSLVATDYLNSTSVTGKAGVLIDLPRIDYSSGAGALLLEPSRQQLIQYSEYLSTFGGTATINDNAIISPEGLQNAAEVILSASGTDSFYKEVAVTANTKYTLSFYVKQGSNTNNQLAVRDQTNATFIATDVSYTASSTEWKRIEYTFTTPAGCVEARIYPHRSSLSSVGNGYFYGIQVEAGSYATSYIPNHGESGGVTRAADSCSVTGASDVIGQTEGTLYAEFDFEKLITGNSGRILCIGDNSVSNRLGIGIGANGKFEGFVVSAGTLVAYLQTTDVITELRNYKMALAYKANDFALYINGVQIGTDNGGAVPTGMNKIFVGLFEIGGSGSQPSNPIKQTTLFKERLSNAELAALTA